MTLILVEVVRIHFLSLRPESGFISAISASSSQFQVTTKAHNYHQVPSGAEIIEMRKSLCNCQVPFPAFFHFSISQLLANIPQLINDESETKTIIF